MAHRKSLLTAKLRKSLPGLRSQEYTRDPIVHAKFFNPTGAGTWYVLEFDGKDEFFGFVELFPGEGELGSFYLSELEALKLPYGLSIERDIWFTPRPLSTIKNK